MAALASDWLRHFQLLLWNHWIEFNKTWQVGKSQRPLPSLCFSGRFEKQDDCPGLWLVETFWTSSLKPLTGSKISTSSTKFVFFGPIGKTIWPPQLLIGCHIFDFFSETAERDSTKLDRKQELNVFYQVFQADEWTKIAALSDLSKRWHIVLRCTIFGPLGLLFLGSWWMNQSAGQTNLLKREAVLRQFVCSMLWFIPHESRKQEAQRATYRAPENNVPPFWGIGQGGHFCLLIVPQNTNLVEDLASCQVSLNSVQRIQRRSRKCFSQSEARAAILFFRSAQKTQNW